MVFRPTLGLVFAAAAVCVLFAGAAQAQQKQSPAALLLAKQLVEIKGATTMFDPVVDGVIRTNKENILRANPNLSRPLNDIEAQMRTEYAPRRLEVQNQIIAAYAAHFTEQELKDAVAFYQSPLGKKLLAEEPKVLDDSMKAVAEWSDKFAADINSRMRAELKKKGFSPM